MSLKSCLCLSFQSDKISKWKNVLDLVMIGQIACYSWFNFTLHMFDLAWSIHRKYRPNKMRHTLTPLSNHCKFQTVPYAAIVINWYRVIFKKVSFGVFKTVLVSKEEKIFTIKSKDKGLSLNKFSWHLIMVKIIIIRHSKGHISQTNHDLINIFMQK